MLAIYQKATINCIVKCGRHRLKRSSGQTELQVIAPLIADSRWLPTIGILLLLLLLLLVDATLIWLTRRS